MFLDLLLRREKHGSSLHLELEVPLLAPCSVFIARRINES